MERHFESCKFFLRDCMRFKRKRIVRTVNLMMTMASKFQTRHYFKRSKVLWYRNKNCKKKIVVTATKRVASFANNDKNMAAIVSPAELTTQYSTQCALRKSVPSPRPKRDINSHFAYHTVILVWSSDMVWSSEKCTQSFIKGFLTSNAFATKTIW